MNSITAIALILLGVAISFIVENAAFRTKLKTGLIDLGNKIKTTWNDLVS